jgi:tetratricopeptide (TPR) repeat protein
MKCLEKDRTRRYDTANGLAADIQRHLKNEPILARPPSRLYQFQKMAQRNKVAFSASAAVVVALLVGLIVSTWAFVREHAARRQAAIEAGKSRQIAKFLKDMIRGIEPSVAMERDTTLLREIADQTMAEMEKERNVPPEVEVELRATMGTVYHHLANYQKAERLHRETLPRMRALLGNVQPAVADLLRDFACVLRDRDKNDESEEIARQSLAVSRQLYGPNHPDVAASLQQLASTLDARKQFSEAEALHRQSLDMFRSFRGSEHRDIAMGLRWLANSFDGQGRLEEAEATYRQALAMMKKVNGASHPEVAAVLSYFTDLLRRAGKFEEEERLLREQLLLYRKLLGNERNRVANTLNALGVVIHNRGRFGEAEPYLREALVIRKKLLGEAHKDVALSMYNLGMTLHAQEGLSEAEEMFRSAEAILRKVMAADDDVLLLTVRNLALVLLAQRKYAEAESPLRECAMQARRKGAPPEKVENWLADLADAIYRQNKFAEAEALYREVLESRNKRLAEDHEGVITAKASIGRLLAEWAWVEQTVASRSALASTSSANQQRTAISPLVRAREGARLLQECLTTQLHGTNASHWRASDIRSRLGGALLSVAVTDADLSTAARSNKLAEAEALLLDAQAALQQTRAGRKYKHDAIERLLRLYEVWPKPTQTAIWQAKLQNLEQTKAEKVVVPVQEARQ